MNMFQIKILFRSDWHVGEGAGAAGYIDRIVRRDPQDSLPYVPAKTLTGILRDACERVAFGLDNAAPGAWQVFVGALFGQQSTGSAQAGTTTRARLSIRPGRFAPDLRQALCQDADLRAALVFVKPGVAIDAKGVARNEALRMEEVVLAGSVLTAEAELEIDDEDLRRVALALLAAGARAAERLGGKRRRGNGRCQIEIVDAPADLLRVLGEAAPTLPVAAPALLTLNAAPPRENQWQRIALDLELLGPLVIPERTAGNVISSRDDIPGSLLLPALDRRLRKLLGNHAAALTTALAGGAVQVRNAYPLRDGERLLPVPAALMAEKERPNVVINELCAVKELDGFDESCTASDAHVQRKQLRSGYVSSGALPTAAAASSPIHEVERLASTHAVIEDRQQRPTAAVGGVYTYEAIRAAQRFRAELWIDSSLLAEPSASSVLDGELRIGRAKKDDYGRVRITASVLAAPLPATGEIQRFSLWLVSPLLARDERLRPIVEASSLLRWLAQLLDAKLTCERAFVRALRDDGWNTAWREPRLTRFGLAAGCCFLFSVAGAPLAAERLARLAAEGLGERRGEGYGEVRIDAPVLGARKPPIAPNNPGEQRSTAGVKCAVTPFSQQIVERAWRQGIRRQALAGAADFARDVGWHRGKPENSQLGALRSQFEQWQGTASQTRFSQWLAQLRATKNRIDKWPGESLAALQPFAENPLAVWSRVDADLLPLLPDHERQTFRDKMADEATRIFWLTVIGAEFDRRASKED